MKDAKKIIGLLVIIIVLISAFFYFFPKFKKVEDTDISKATRNTLSWIDGQKNNDGIYNYDLVCLNDDCTETEELSTNLHQYSFIFWARYKGYKNGDSSQLSELENDVNNFINLGEQEYSLQLNFWNCKLMEDIYNDKEISEEIKESIFNICTNSGTVMDNQAETDEKIASLIEKIESGEEITIEDKEYYVESFIFNAGSSSENSTLYNVSKEYNSTYFRLAVDYFKNALYGYEPGIESNSILGIASLDLYKITNSDYFLSFANYLYNNAKEIEDNTIDEYENPYVFSYLLFFSQELEEVSSENQEEFLTYQNKLKDTIISNGFDKKGYPSYKYDQGAFSSFPGSGYYSVKENAFIIGVLNN